MTTNVYEVQITGREGRTWHDRTVTVLAGDESEAFEAARRDMADRGFDEARQLSARVTGTYRETPFAETSNRPVMPSGLFAEAPWDDDPR